MRIQNLIAKATLIAVVGTMGLSACTTTPTSGTSVSRKADGAGMYRVRSGDTLSLIARANGVSVSNLMAWNNLTNPDYLEVGWRLRVRPNASGSTSVTAPTPAPTSGRAQATINDPEIKVNTTITNNVVWNWPSSNSIIRNFDGNLTKGVVFGGDRGSAPRWPGQRRLEQGWHVRDRHRDRALRRQGGRPEWRNAGRASVLRCAAFCVSRLFCSAFRSPSPRSPRSAPPDWR